MINYALLASRYDELQGDIPYEELADFYEGIIKSRAQNSASPLVLDLGCGTGSLALILAQRGYELIAVDASASMLSTAQQKISDANPPRAPLLLCQRAQDLDLYGTVDAALCCLDVFNYLTPQELKQALVRLFLFIAPGGALAFDILRPEHLRSLDGGVFLDEREDFLCIWRAQYSEGENALVYALDLFEECENGNYTRHREEHKEYCHEICDIIKYLENAGFCDVIVHENTPQVGKGRVFISAIRP